MASTVFTYEGTDRSGRKIGGEIISTNANIAKAELRKQGINPSKVSKKRANLNLSILGPKITPGDIALFTRQLATMMKAGVPLVQSFEIVADGVDSPPMKDLILKIRDEVSAGNSFADAIGHSLSISMTYSVILSMLESSPGHLKRCLIG